MLLFCLHLLSHPLPAWWLEEGLLDEVMWGWSHHRNRDSGLIYTLSCSPAAWREHRSSRRDNHSSLTLPVVQNHVKQYQCTQGRIFRQIIFSIALLIYSRWIESPTINLLHVLLSISMELFPCACTRQKNLISWFYYFSVCQKSSNFSKSTRALCKKLGCDSGCR